MRLRYDYELVRQISANAAGIYLPWLHILVERTREGNLCTIPLLHQNIDIAGGGKGNTTVSAEGIEGGGGIGTVFRIMSREILIHLQSDFLNLLFRFDIQFILWYLP